MKIICVGRNYADHAKELHNDLPKEPVIFIKPKTAILLPRKPLFYPEFTDDLQYECEVILRISKNGKHIQEKFGQKYFDGVSVGIDFTARDLQREQQKKGLPWEIAKSFDGSAALGNFIPMTEDTDLGNLSFRLDKNGETVQTGNTADMLFSVGQILAYVSRFVTINIGDILFTGTPAGVGPVSTDDKLEGYLMGEKVLDVDIR